MGTVVTITRLVIPSPPAKAGVQDEDWMPAYAGMDGFRDCL